MIVTASRVFVALVIGIAAGLAACTESAERSFDFTSQARPTRTVTIDNFHGSVNVKKGPAGSAVTGRVRVTATGFDSKGEARDAAADVSLSESGTVADVELVVLVPQVRGPRDFDIDMDLAIPDGVAVDIETDGGRISVDSLPFIELDTTAGPVTTRFTSGNGVIRTSDFPISVESHTGNIDARTSNAEIELISIAGNARALTTVGPVTARVSPPTGGEVFIATTVGGVDLTIAREFGARLTAVTSGAGLVFVEGLPFVPRGSFPGQAEGTIGNGQGIVDVRTSESDIVIRGR